MIDLRNYLKLNIQYNNNQLFYTGDTVIVKTGDRKLTDMADVVLNDNLTCPTTVYKIAMGVSKAKDQSKWEDIRLRYDMTIIPANFIGIEYVKTIGHYHELAIGKHFTYPEVLEVIYGTGMIILQKPFLLNELATTITEMYDFSLIEECYLIRVNKGDKVVIPPGFAHAIINIKNQPLMVGNVQSVAVKHLIDPIKERHGLSYYIIHKNARIEIVQNPHYRILNKMKKMKLPDFKTPVSIKGKQNLYTIILNNPDKFTWLNNPDTVNW